MVARSTDTCDKWAAEFRQAKAKGSRLEFPLIVVARQGDCPTSDFSRETIEPPSAFHLSDLLRSHLHQLIAISLC